MGALFYRKGVSLVLGLRRLIVSSGGPDFLLDVSSTVRRLLGMLPVNSPLCEFVVDGYGVWLDILTGGVDPLDFGGVEGAHGDGSRRGRIGGDSDRPRFSRVGSSCFVLYSFATDVLTAASSLVPVVRPGSAVPGVSYAYVGPLSSLAGAGDVLAGHGSGAAFVFCLVSYSVPAILPVGLLSASSSGLGCVSLSLESLDSLAVRPGAGVGIGGDGGDVDDVYGVDGNDGGFGGAGGDVGDVSGGAGGAATNSHGELSRECIFLAFLGGDDGGGGGDDDDGTGIHSLRGLPSPPLSYYAWSFVRSSLSRFYQSVGASERRLPTVGVRGVSASSSPLRFSDLSLRFSGSSSLSDGSASEDEIVSLVRSVRRAFD